MADDLNDLGRRIDRIELALRRPPENSSRSAGPEIRSARSIVNRVDDVWVAVTEGNDRLLTAVDGLRAELSRLADALLTADPPRAEGGPPDAHADPGPDQPADPGSGEPLLLAGNPTGTADALGGRLQQIEEAVAALASPSEPGDDLDGRLARIEQLLAALGPPSDSGDAADAPGRLQRIEETLTRLAESGQPDPAVHLRLNRVEEALAGIAGRLEELRSAAHAAPADPDDEGTGWGAQAAVEVLSGEVRTLASRVDGLAQALEASAARAADATLAERVGRLRDQFRR